MLSLLSESLYNQRTMEKTYIVGAEQTAQVMGSGDMPVLATPALVAMMENAAMLCARQLLTDGETTVGGSIDVRHLAPSPVGAEIRVVAELTERDGRRLMFSIRATEGEKEIGIANHVRYAVNRERFLAKLRS